MVHGFEAASHGAKGVLSAAAHSLIAPLGMVLAGLVFIAESGLNFRRYKQGKISKKECIARVKHGAAGTVGSMIGVTAGVAIGFTAGSALFPVVGSLVGAGIGAVAGMIAGKYVGLKILCMTERAIAQVKKNKLKKIQ